MELAEWQEDLRNRHTGSRIVLAEVPAGWGRTAALDCFQAKLMDQEDAPAVLIVRINGLDFLGYAALQAHLLQASLVKAVQSSGESAGGPRTVALLGLDEPGSQAQLGLGIGALFFSGLTAGISFLLAGLTVGAAQKAWNDSPAGQNGALARAARALAAVSVSKPVVIIIDDADCLDTDLAVTIAENLTARHNGQVLLVAAVDPGNALTKALRENVREGVTSKLVHTAEVDSDMGYGSRLGLVRDLCPYLPDEAARRIAQRTITLGEVFEVTSASGLTDLGPGSESREALAVVDAATRTRLMRSTPSPEATVIAWAGGLVHVRQAARALSILRAGRDAEDPDVRRWESLERVADPATPRLAEAVTAGLATTDRQALAAVFLDEALVLTASPDVSPVDKVAALKAAHKVRTDLPARGQLPELQSELVALLEALGDNDAAVQVAGDALAEWPPGASDSRERDMLGAAMIRLSRVTSQVSTEPLVRQLIAEAATGGAAIGLEAQVWAAVVLLDTPGQRDAALDMVRQAAAGLDAVGLGAAGDRWRLLLAYHAGRADLPDFTMRLLAPMITSADAARYDAAAQVRLAVRGPGADTRLQNIILEAELAALPADADDDRLRIHYTLAENYADLGDFGRALEHGNHELALRNRILGPRHPGTLATRARIAGWTGQCGDERKALQLYQELLPDREEILGPRDSRTLVTRASIAIWTGQTGDLTTALFMLGDLLPELQETLGAQAHDTLIARGMFAYLTGTLGAADQALRMSQELLIDREEVFGPRHPDTLDTRANIARWTSHCGDVATAMRLGQELLRDRKEILGPSHPDTLSTQADLAQFASQLGDLVTALRLSRELLPDLKEILGARHPDTLATRFNIAYWTGLSGNAATALSLYQTLLPDVEEILGTNDSRTLLVRNAIASLTAGGA